MVSELLFAPLVVSSIYRFLYLVAGAGLGLVGSNTRLSVASIFPFFVCLLALLLPTMVNRIFLMVCRSLERFPLAPPLLRHFRTAFLLNPCQSKLDLFQRSYLHHPGNLFSFLDSVPDLRQLLEYHNEISFSHSRQKHIHLMSFL